MSAGVAEGARDELGGDLLGGGAVAGGGELGEKWRLAGRMYTKLNTFNDFVDSAKWLVANKYTSPDRLVIQGAGAYFDHGLLQQVAGIILSRYPLPTDNPFVNQFFNLLFGGRPKPSPLVEFVIRQCWQTDQSVMAHRFHLIRDFDIASRLDSIQVPGLIMAGTRDLLVSETSRQTRRMICLARKSWPQPGHHQPI